MDKAAQIKGIKDILGARIDTGTWEDIDECAEALYAAGYRKLPERPKVLSKEDVIKYLREHKRETQAIGEWGMFRIGNQAQLEADIRHIWGEE
uniref:Uncharacterized protein n=1 Tax=viral metagenome TaxID=1070528 RepID=A0A6M3LSW9_9ZZZZ